MFEPFQVCPLTIPINKIKSHDSMQSMFSFSPILFQALSFTTSIMTEFLCIRHSSTTPSTRMSAFSPLFSQGPSPVLSYHPFYCDMLPAKTRVLFFQFLLLLSCCFLPVSLYTAQDRAHPISVPLSLSNSIQNDTHQIHPFSHKLHNLIFSSR